MINAVFTDTDTITVFGLWQYDREQTLKIEGLELVEGTQVHFANCKSQTAIVKAVTGGMVEIPEELLMQPYNITAWLYGDNETLKTIILPLQKRTKPDDYVSVNESMGEIEKIIDESGVIEYDSNFQS